MSIQKDDALKAFDDQITAINDLAEAEERLTATQEYEAAKRKRDRDRELQQQNYQKERALAIYEGRIDDARNLDLQDQKNFQDYQQEKTDAEVARNKVLQGNNRADAIKIIENQKSAASKLFDEAIKEFNDYVEEVTRNGTISETQMREQFQKIADKAKLTSGQINTAFTTLFGELPGKIQAGLGEESGAAGFFTIGLDTLIKTAKKKFGLDANTENADSILGLTSSMLTGANGMAKLSENAFATGGPIQTAYGSGIDALYTYIDNKLNGTGDTSLAGIFKKAVAMANEDFKAELDKNKEGAGSAMAEFVKYLNKQWEKLAIADATKAALAAAKSSIQQAINDANNAGTGVVDMTKPVTYWVRKKSGNASDWIAVPASGMDRYMGNSAYMITMSNGVKPAFFNGGLMSYGDGGPTYGPMGLGIPATLHGGEFVIRKAAVDKYGLDMLSKINTGIYAPSIPKLRTPMANYSKISTSMPQSVSSTSESNHNYNFYVDNFIGETEWFNSMMKEYNVKVVPANQKQAGLETRIVRTYNGINKGM